MTGRAGLEVDTLTIRIPIRLRRRGGRKLIVTPDGVAAPARKPSRDETLVKALVRAHRWRRRIESGRAKSITDLAEQEGVSVAYVCRLLPLTCLAPDAVEAILDGRQPKGLGLAEMVGNGPPVWEEQRRQLSGTAAMDRLAEARAQADCGPITVSCSQELTSSSKLGEQHLGLLQIGSVEAFGEPTVDRREQVISSLPLAAIGP
jgi:hypothetical protein